MKRGNPFRNPAGRNQYTADRELRQEYRALCRAIDEAPGPVAEAIYEQLATVLADRLAERDRGSERLLIAFLDREWPLPDPHQYARLRENSERRVVSCAESPSQRLADAPNTELLTSLVRLLLPSENLRNTPVSLRIGGDERDIRTQRGSGELGIYADVLRFRPEPL